MEPRDEASDAGFAQVTDVVSLESMAEAAASAVAEATSGVAVVHDPSAGPQDASDPESSLELLEEIAPHKNGQLKDVIECMLFVASEPLSAKQIAESLELDEPRIEEALRRLEKRLEGGSGLQLAHVAGGYQLCTRPEYADYCTIILQPAKRKLSKAALETLAVVAYRQPCTMPEVEAVRGVSVDGVMRTLMERGLVKEAGRKQTPGRPILYATTPEFLEYFGLQDISQLPDIDTLAIEEVKALEAQKELFEEQAATGSSEQSPPETEE